MLSQNVSHSLEKYKTYNDGFTIPLQSALFEANFQKSGAIPFARTQGWFNAGTDTPPSLCFTSCQFHEVYEKVDNVKALNLLVNLELVHFIDLDGQGDLMDAMKQEVTKMIPTLPSAFTRASERMVTPIFFGREKNIAIVFDYSVKANGKWHTVKEDALCSYTPLDAESIDDADKQSQQLLFKKQVELLTAVKDVFEWQVQERLGIAAILRLDFLAKLSQ
ncbi:unnamed protein product [Angiostrongylus costaricensis]|uniref:SapC protein n=1 Tax=Angiostrongylus costaricensis TaxID=334426 RepID=A0A0R3PS51_ANGCS|nr:unnamed protein product [Angiostrongylus costaricensis]